MRASENLHFSQGECDREAMDATFLPFIRNTVGSMDFGGSTVSLYSDDAKLNGSVRQARVSKRQQINVTIPAGGGMVIL